MKFKILLLQFLKVTHIGITIGECDFCERNACVGARLSTDVFYLCEVHKCALSKSTVSK